MGCPDCSCPTSSASRSVLDDARDYADENARLQNARTVQWVHPLGETINSVMAAGMRLDWLHEHDSVPWRMFRCLQPTDGGAYRWPGEPWLPLAFSLMATRSEHTRRLMEGARMVPRPAATTLEMLRQLERKVLWLSSYMIHHANHEVDRGDGLKVGGHQASSASLVTLMTALYFHVLRPEDRVAGQAARQPGVPRHPVPARQPDASTSCRTSARSAARSPTPRAPRTRPTSTSRPARSAWALPRPALPAWCRTTCTPRAGAPTGPRAA